MRLGLLFRRALYRELRSSIGYYDARRIVRSIEDNSEELADLGDLTRVLNELGFDRRQVQLAVEAARRNSFLLKEEQGSI
jgi:hypothetical protein